MTEKTEDMLNDDQLSCAAWLESVKAGILWADVGTGKTVSTLTALLRKLLGFDAHKILVIGPRLVAERVWSAEVADWAHLRGLRVQRIVGTEKQRLAALGRDADIYTLTRDNVKWLEELFIRIVGTKPDGQPIRAQYRRWPFDTIVLDESQSFMSGESQRFKSMRRIRLLPGVCNIYLLSGSLMPNGYRCLWSQLFLVDGGARLGTSEDAYMRRYFTREVNDGVVTYELREGCAAQIDRKIADVVKVMRDMQQAVPHNHIRVRLDKQELKLYREMKRKNVLTFGDKQINAVNSGVLWGKLLQLANGAVYDGERVVHHLHDRKIEALLELLESLQGKVLIGYGFVHDIDRVLAALKKAGIQGVGVIRTNASLEAWKRDEIRVGVIHPASAGHGLNDLKDASHIVWFGLTPNFEYFQQLNGRVIGGHRRGDRQIGIHILVAEDTVDEDAVNMLQIKDGTQVTAQIRVAQSWIKGGPHEGNINSRTAEDADRAA